MSKIAQTMKKAFPRTIPVMMGYLFVGIAFGMLFQQRGYNFFWAFLISLTVYAGSMQFVALNFFTAGTSLLTVAFMTFMVNFRHLFYGLSFLDRYRLCGKLKPYLIFSLTDETYSLLCSTHAPEGISDKWFVFFISFLNQLYWIAGSVIGSVAGSMIRFNTKGVDFAMTALFVVIFIEQWRSYETHLPVFVGVGCTLLCLFVFGVQNFILPAMLCIVAALFVLRHPIGKKLDNTD